MDLGTKLLNSLSSGAWSSRMYGGPSVNVQPFGVQNVAADDGNGQTSAAQAGKSQSSAPASPLRSILSPLASMSTQDFLMFAQAAGNLSTSDDASDAAYDPNGYIADASGLANAQVTQTDFTSIPGAIGFIPGDVFQQNSEQATTDYQRGRLDDMLSLLKIEEQLKSLHGSEVKVGYDRVSEEYAMLRPGDPGYEQVDTGQQVLDKTMNDFRRGFADIKNFADIFNKYGYDASVA